MLDSLQIENKEKEQRINKQPQKQTSSLTLKFPAKRTKKKENTKTYTKIY